MFQLQAQHVTIKYGVAFCLNTSHVSVTAKKLANKKGGQACLNTSHVSVTDKLNK